MPRDFFTFMTVLVLLVAFSFGFGSAFFFFGPDREPVFVIPENAIYVEDRSSVERCYWLADNSTRKIKPMGYGPHNKHCVGQPKPVGFLWEQD